LEFKLNLRILNICNNFDFNFDPLKLAVFPKIISLLNAIIPLFSFSSLMGIKGLLKVLKQVQKPKNISKYAGKKVAIDAYCW
jgi:hypothetical protein